MKKQLLVGTIAITALIAASCGDDDDSAEPADTTAASRSASGRLAFSPYVQFSRSEWARLREDTPMTLVARDLEQMSGLIEDLSIEEVEQIYLPLSRLLNLYVAATQELYAATNRFLGRKDTKVPFILGIAIRGISKDAEFYNAGIQDAKFIRKDVRTVKTALASIKDKVDAAKGPSRDKDVTAALRDFEKIEPKDTIVYKAKQNNLNPEDFVYETIR